MRRWLHALVLDTAAAVLVLLALWGVVALVVVVMGE